MSKLNNLRAVVAQTERAQAVLLAAVIAAGGQWRAKTTLYKAFWWSHIESMRTRGAELSEHQIVRLPHGPAPNDGDDLLAGLIRGGHLKSSTVDHDRYKVDHYEVPDVESARKWVEKRLSSDAIAVISEAAKKFAGMTAKEASDFSHEFSHEWRRRYNGHQMDIYSDLVPESKLATAAIETREVSEQLAALFGSKPGR